MNLKQNFGEVRVLKVSLTYSEIISPRSMVVSLKPSIKQPVKADVHLLRLLFPAHLFHMD